MHDPTSLTILINLDHAFVAAALGDGFIVRVLFHWLGGGPGEAEEAVAIAVGPDGLVAEW